MSFWIIKVLTTGMGEAASDALVRSFGAAAVAVVALAWVGSFVAQFRVDRYIPWVYWSAVAMVSVFGTMVADIPHALGVPVWVTSAVYLLIVIALFAWWQKAEGTLSFAAITSGRRERFYWAAVLATFALGTAVGDLTAFTWHWGALISGLVFAVLITLPTIARRWLGLNAVAAFWSAYVLTRPLGASFADWMAISTRHGGLGWGAPLVAGVWVAAILGVVGYLVVRRRSRQLSR
jgi:uncharacterized membrane-anchored protein